MTESRVIYVDFDHLQEQLMPDQKDTFYILDSSKKIYHLIESMQVVEADEGVNSFTKEAVYTVDRTVDLEKKLGPKTLNMMNMAKIFNIKWPLYNITLRAIQHRNITIGFDCDDKVIPTLGEEMKAEAVMAARGTAFVVGYARQKSGAHLFFAKPNMGSRSTDCLGTRGPLPTQSHIIGNGLIIFTWKDFVTNKETTKIFSSNGRYHGTVLQPKCRQNADPNERCDNMVPLLSSYDSQYFLMVRKVGAVWEGGVSRLIKRPDGQYEFDEITEIKELGDINKMFFQINASGELLSVQVEYLDEFEDKQILGYTIDHKRSKWQQIFLRLPELAPFGDN